MKKQAVVGSEGPPETVAWGEKQYSAQRHSMASGAWQTETQGNLAVYKKPLVWRCCAVNVATAASGRQLRLWDRSSIAYPHYMNDTSTQNTI